MARSTARLQRGVNETGTVFTDAERRYLSDFRLGRIATVGRDGTPHVAPVGWSYEPERDVIEVRGSAEVLDDPPRIRIHPQRIVSWGLDGEDFYARDARTVG